MSHETPDHFFGGAAPIALVAGGAGFIGSHFCKRLLEKDVKVICVDNWLTGLKENVAHLKNNENFLLLEEDVTKELPKDVDRLDYIIHLAGVEAYLNGEDVSKETLEVNSIGTKNLLELAKEKKARFLLVSTINVFSANISPISVKEYFGKDRIFEGEFSHHEAKRFAEALTSEYGLKESVDTRVVRLADVYGPKMMLSSARPLANLIKQALYGGPLKIPGGEEVILYPAYIDDVIQGVERALFSSGVKNKIVSLAGPKTSAFSLARTLAGLKKENLEIEFSEEEQAGREYSKEILEAGRELISWKPETTLEQGLVETLTWFKAHKSHVPGKEQEVKPAQKKSFWGDKDTPSSKPKVWKLIALLVALFLFWFLLFPPLQFALSVGQLALAKNRAMAGDFDQTAFWVRGASDWASAAEEGFSRWQKIPVLNLFSSSPTEKSRLLKRVSKVAMSAAQAGKEAESLFAGVFGDEPFDSQIPAGKLALELGVLDRELAFLETEPGELTLSREFNLGEIRSTIRAVLPLVNNANEILGKSSKKTYLVLLQNNMELRPTGGFIGSFALLTFEDGRFINLEVQDVYSADGQLKGHVEPPAPIKEHLGEAAWFLRDANWSPDFPTTARRSAWFIEKELGQKVDGVIAVDLEIAKQLIAAAGPITLNDFNEQITEQNLYEKTQYAVEGDFFPGSRAKKDFLTALSRELFFEFFGQENDLTTKKMAVFARSVLSVLNSRHMAIWIDNSDVMNELRKVGWDGGLRSPVCRNQEGCIADYLMVVEANLGVNKANYFLDRSFSLEIAPQEKELSHKLTITYQNRSQDGVWPGGDYKNYVRFLLPTQASNFSTRIINPTTGEELKPELDVILEKEEKRSVGMLVTIPAKQERQVVFSWGVPIKTESKEVVFLWQKQLGTGNDPLWLNFKLPEEQELVSVFPTPSLTELSSVGYNTNLAQDLVFDFQWQTQR